LFFPHATGDEDRVEGGEFGVGVEARKTIPLMESIRTRAAKLMRDCFDMSFFS